jgi:hypothetical protein
MEVVDDWFAFFDGREIDVGSQRWRAVVLAIHDQDGDLWIQISPSDDADRSIVVRCRPSQSTDSVLDALRRYRGDVNGGVTRLPRIIDARDRR